jgi:hypothetical protein
VLRKWLLMAMQLSQPTALQDAEAREFIHGSAGREEEQPIEGGKKDRPRET